MLKPFVPLDKSWLIRLGILDLLHDSLVIDEFLAQHEAELNTDLLAMKQALIQWRSQQPIDVGESGTLYRFLQFAAWQRGEDRQFIKHGTLVDRPITTDPAIVHLPLTELLQLDNGTSQWASAAVLLGNTEPQPSPLPFKLALTYEALAHWEKTRPWQARLDQTIASQAAAYLEWVASGEMNFTPHQAEDYCFARAFDLMTAAEGEARWPALRQHESDRIAAMETALTQSLVDSADHRVIQAVALKRGSNVRFKHPEAVAKSWPQFWLFYDEFHH